MASEICCLASIRQCPRVGAVIGVMTVATTVACARDQRGELSSAAGVPVLNLQQVAASNGEIEFSGITDLAVASDGRVYVADWQDARINVLSPDLQRIERTLGRRGEGPGEFQYISSLQILPGDSLLAFDLSLNRISVFPPGADTTAYVLNLAAKANKATPYWVRRVPGTDRYLAAYRRGYTPKDDPSDQARRRETLSLLSLDGSIQADSLLSFPARQSLVSRDGKRVVVGDNPFGRRGVFDLGPDGKIYSGWNDSLLLDIRSLTGARLRRIALPAERIPVTPGELAEAAQEIGPQLERELRREAPDTWPAFRSFVVDDEGRIWLATYKNDDGMRNWLLLDSTGRILGRTLLRADVEIRRFREGRIYGTTGDASEVPGVVIYALPAAIRSAPR